MNAEDNSIVCECDLPDPPEKVWRALTVPELLAEWLMPNDIRPQEGARFHFEPPAQSPERAIECEVLEMRPNQLLRYTWRTAANESEADEHPLDSIVTFELTRTPAGGTHLRVVHDIRACQTNVVPFRSRARGAVGMRAQRWMGRWAA